MRAICFVFLTGSFAVLAADNDPLPHGDAKYIETKRVFDRLARAAAADAPELIVTRGKPDQAANFARFERYESRIYFSEHVYDTCASLGGSTADCIAFILGHELAHHYLGHLWESQVASAGAIGNLADRTVSDKEARTPAPEQRDRIVELAFDRGVLLLGCGPNSIRLAPPLIVTKEQADIALDVLEECINLVAIDYRHATGTKHGGKLA